MDGQIISVFDTVKSICRACQWTKSWNWIIDGYVATATPASCGGRGEVKLANLNLNWEEHFGVYTAPLQMKANNGILCIDDFGRQAIAPQQLLNRLILPLDRSIDYLSLRHGFTFNVPFVLMLAFAANLEPLEIADEAFLRRIPSKVFLGLLTGEMFDEIFRRRLHSLDLTASPESGANVPILCGELSRHALQGCYPIDILEILVSSAVYRDEAVEITCGTPLEAAAEMYFAHGWQGSVRWGAVRESQLVRISRAQEDASYQGKASATAPRKPSPRDREPLPDRLRQRNVHRQKIAF